MNWWILSINLEAYRNLCEAEKNRASDCRTKRRQNACRNDSSNEVYVGYVRLLV
jgi:hypothetical protein